VVGRWPAGQIPAPVLFLVSGVAMYLGAAVAHGLFEELGPLSLGWWRITFAALILLIARRPWQRSWNRRQLLWAVAFGLVLATMNMAFYQAIAYLPLGVAVSIEFAGPVAVAALTGRGFRERLAIVVAAIGVVLLAGVTLDAGQTAWVGLIAVGIAATAWAGYILLGKRVSLGGAGIDSLTLGLTAGSLALAPFFARGAIQGVAARGPARAVLAVLGVLALVGLLNSVVPYVLDQVVLRRVGTATFAVFTALLPAVATVVGVVALRQVPAWTEWLGLALVSTAIVLTNLRDRGSGVGSRAANVGGSAGTPQAFRERFASELPTEGTD